MRHLDESYPENRPFLEAISLTEMEFRTKTYNKLQYFGETCPAKTGLPLYRESCPPTTTFLFTEKVHILIHVHQSFISCHGFSKKGNGRNRALFTSDAPYFHGAFRILIGEIAISRVLSNCISLIPYFNLRGGQDSPKYGKRDGYRFVL